MRGRHEGGEETAHHAQVTGLEQHRRAELGKLQQGPEDYQGEQRRAQPAPCLGIARGAPGQGGNRAHPRPRQLSRRTTGAPAPNSAGTCNRVGSLAWVGTTLPSLA